MRTLLAALLLATGAPAFATAAQAFREGNFAEAVKQGHSEATAASLVIAGRATLNIAGYGLTDKAQAKAQIALAERDFDAAIAKAPNNLEARTYKAIAAGYRSKLDKSPGEARESRKLMEAVLARDPNYALANAALGGWHGGAVATLGSFIASTVLGASRKESERYFAIALAREPRNIIHPVTYAFTLLDLDADNAPQAKTLLKSAIAMPVGDAYDAQNRKGAQAVLALIDKGDNKGARTLAKRIQPFGAVG
jgi:hypothetical protein